MLGNINIGGLDVLVNTTSSVVVPQLVVVVQRNVAEPVLTVTAVVALLALVIDAVPETTLQLPVPLAAIVKLPLQFIWSGPALAATPVPFSATVVTADVAVQPLASVIVTL